MVTNSNMLIMYKNGGIITRASVKRDDGGVYITPQGTTQLKGSTINLHS